LEKWVETRQLISKTGVDWVAEKEMMDASVAMFEKELKDLTEQFNQLGNGSEEVERERTALEEEKALLEEVREAARQKASTLEGQLPVLIARLPESLRERLKPLTEQLPADSVDTRMSPVERLQTLVGILNEIDKFSSSISVESEIRQTPEGAEVEVQTLYLGLAQAYFVGEGGSLAGVGHPSSKGWEWTTQKELAAPIQKAIAIYRNQQPAAFVELPITLK
jgi:hypothetical protein